MADTLSFSPALYLLLAAFAVYRLAHLAAYEDGPFDAVGRVRSRMQTNPKSPEWLSEGAGCPMCISFYLGFLFALPMLFWGFGIGLAVLFYVVGSLALSGATVLFVNLSPLE